MGQLFHNNSRHVVLQKSSLLSKEVRQPTGASEQDHGDFLTTEVTTKFLFHTVTEESQNLHDHSSVVARASLGYSIIGGP